MDGRVCLHSHRRLLKLGDGVEPGGVRQVYVSNSATMAEGCRRGVEFLPQASTLRSFRPELDFPQPRASAPGPAHMTETIITVAGRAGAPRLVSAPIEA